jgi:peptide chain release factor 2
VIEIDEFRSVLSGYRQPLAEVKDSLDIDSKIDKIAKLNYEMEQPGFWDDTDNSREVSRELKGLQDLVDGYRKLEEDFSDMETLTDMADEEQDESLIPEIAEQLTLFEEEFKAYRINLLFSGEFDNCNAILTLHSGEGGTESCDWANMLYRMYTRWAEKHAMTVEMLDYLEGDEAGIKSVTIQISGAHAYGYLKSEKGVHRLVRISPFNSAGKRMTSFAACDVVPDIEEDVEVEIRDEDLRVDTYRSSGAGGQHINKTSSAVRITHLPTGIVVQCQNERSQLMNKNKAMQMLKSKLYLIKQQENLEKMSDIRGEVTDNGFGSQIRSYVMQPYTMVKDKRTGFENANVSAVLDGDLDGFMTEYLKWINKSD